MCRICHSLIINNYITTVNSINYIYDICCLAVGGEEAFRANPFILQYVEPITPLVNPRESLDKLMFCAKNGIPMMYAPAGTLGGTTPVTFAGGFALTNAENLMGITLMQAVKKGAHFVYGGGPGLLHPRLGTFNYGPPEGFTTRMIRWQLAKWYGFPDFNAAACSDAKQVDQQAAFEAGIGLFVTTLIGANVVHDVGYIDSGLTSSLEILTLADEMIPLVRRSLVSPEISPDHLAMDVIKKVGIGGNYLANKHTVKHFREEIQLSDFWERGTYDAWERAGRQSPLDKVNEKVRGILAGPASAEELPAKVVEDINRVVGDIPTLLTPGNMNVVGIQMHGAVYEWLVSLAADKVELQPELAESWESSDDYKVWTLKLRPGVKWHNGQAFTAEDVIFTIERTQDPALGHKSLKTFEVVDKIEKVDDLTVKITLKEARPRFMATLTDYNMPVLCRTYDYAKLGETAPMGTGPFMVKSIVPKENVVAVKIRATGWPERPRLTRSTSSGFRTSAPGPICS